MSTFILLTCPRLVACAKIKFQKMVNVGFHFFAALQTKFFFLAKETKKTTTYFDSLGYFV
jgi:hypothetical protein